MEHRIGNITIPFDENWSRIAISLSGGADSALLAYILCKLALQLNPKISIHIISHIRCWKTKPWQEYDSLRVYNYLSQKFNLFNWYRHTNFIAPDLEYGVTGPSLTDEYNKKVSGDNIQIRAYSEYICTKYKINAYYNGVTRNPKKEFAGKMTERDIDLNDDNQHLRIMKHMDVYAIHPFRFVDKSWVMTQYKEFGISDLLDLTRSCEGEFSNITYKNYRSGQYVPTCGECFWCQERNWAIENGM